LELTIAQLIGRLIFPILNTLFLYSIIRKMHHTIVQAVKIELSAASSDIPVLAPISTGLAVNSSQQEKMSDIEFPAIVKKGPGEIILDYIRFAYLIFQ
jgi:hypothetical protein